jgi:hypothetical protein
MDQRYDMVRTARDTRYRYIRNYMPHVPWGQHIAFMWLQAGYREWHYLHTQGELNRVQDRFWHEKPAEELYDLRSDPDEVVNLANDPDHAHVVRRMSKALDRHMLAIHDNGFIPEGSPVEGWNASRRPGAYPLARIMAFAGRAIQRRADFLPTVVHHLHDHNDVMRFWAAQACSMLGAEAAPARKALTAAMLGDASPHVRVAAAEAVARIDAGSSAGAPTAKPLLGLVDPQALLAGTRAELAAAVASVTAGSVPPAADSALGVLGAHLVGHEIYWVRLYAANALENIGAAAFPVLPQLLEACTGYGGSPDEPYVAEACRYTLLKLLGVSADLPDPNAVI